MDGLFCDKCNNLNTHFLDKDKEDEDEKLKYKCQVCGSTKPIEKGCVFINEVNNAKKDYPIQYNLVHDCALLRTRQIPCKNEKCPYHDLQKNAAAKIKQDNTLKDINNTVKELQSKVKEEKQKIEKAQVAIDNGYNDDSQKLWGMEDWYLQIEKSLNNISELEQKINMHFEDHPIILDNLCMGPEIIIFQYNPEMLKNAYICSVCKSYWKN